MNRNLPAGSRGLCPGAISLLREFFALPLVTALLMTAGCGDASPDTSGRSAPDYTIGGTIAGLDEGFVVLSNGLDTRHIDANPDGLALDATFSLDTRLPAGAGYDVRIVNDPQAQFALQCDVINGRGVMPAGKVDNVLVRCARVKSVRLLAGKIPSDSASRDGLATDARFLSPRAVAVDGAGNLYVADSNNHTVRRITPAGVVSTLAGSAGQPGSSDGTGADARFNRPQGVAVDATGHLQVADHLYVADTGNNTIRRITQAGAVSTFAGQAGAPGSTDGTGVVARFSGPQGIAVDATGNLYVADRDNNIIRRITPGGSVVTFAGQAGPPGFTDGTSGARFDHPQGVAVDAAGTVYVADTNNSTVRRITPEGVVSTLAGSATHPGITSGQGVDSRFNFPSSIAVDTAGNVYVADTLSHTIRQITRAPIVSTIAGTAQVPGSNDGTAAEARFRFPQGIAVDTAGNVYVADTENGTVRRVTPAAVVSTIAGSAGLSGSNDGAGSVAQFNTPGGIAIDAVGRVYVADTDNHIIRRATPEGVVSTFAGTARQRGIGNGAGTNAQFSGPRGIAAAIDTDGTVTVYVADTDNSSIRRITAAGVVSTFAGSPGQQGSDNGTGTNARFKLPRGIAVDTSRNVYVADTGNNTIRRITPEGVVSTLAGSAGPADSIDATGANARFDNPEGIAVDATGNVYVADRQASTIRRITPTGVVTTIAGRAGLHASVDGAGIDARFNHPQGLAVDVTGNLYVADFDNSAMRVLTRSGGDTYDVRTIAGGGGPTTARIGPLPQPIGSPRGLFVTQKRMYFTSGDAVLFVDR